MHRGTILVIEDKQAFREPIQKMLLASGYRVICANNGAEALARIRDQKQDVDLVLLDYSMPKLDGLGFLKSVRRGGSLKNTPVILLTAAADKKLVVDFMKLGVNDYLLKSAFSIVELRERIDHCLEKKSDKTASAGKKKEILTVTNILKTRPEILAPRAPTRRDKVIPASVLENTPSFLSSKAIEQALEQGLTGLSTAVTEVMTLSQSGDVDVGRLASIISREPILASQVLKLANSAAYSQRGKWITSLDTAVKLIGFSNVRQIASLIGVFDTLPSSALKQSLAIRVSEHCLAVATIMQQLLPQNPDAYLLGLLHDVSDLVLCAIFPDEYVSALEWSSSQNVRLDELKHKAFGLSGRQISELILKKLALPPPVEKPLLNFVQAPMDPDWEQGEPVIVALRLANMLAHGMGFTPNSAAEIGCISAGALKLLGSEAKIPEPNDVKETVKGLMSGLSVNAAAPRVRLDKSFQDLQVLYFKEKSLWLDIDPLAEVLKTIVKLEHVETEAQVAQTKADIMIIVSKDSSMGFNHKALPRGTAIISVSNQINGNLEPDSINLTHPVSLEDLLSSFKWILTKRNEGSKEA